MKQILYRSVLLAALMVLAVFTAAIGQTTYSASPSGWLSAPGSNTSMSWNSSTVTLHGNLLMVNAQVSGSTVTFNIKKKDGSSFQNPVMLHLYEGGIGGTRVRYKNFAAGQSAVYIDYDPTFTSGSKKYAVALMSRGNSDIWYYTSTVTVTAKSEAAAPTKPSSPSPASGSTNVPTSGTLSWTTASNDGGGVSFDLYMGTGSSGNLKLYDTGRGTSYSYSGLQPGTTYYWKLIVYNGSGKSVQSDVWNFRTKAAAQVSLTIDGGTYFGTKTLTKGKSYAFNIKVKNTGDEPWSGAFYLKDGSTDLIPWGGESIAAGRTTTLSGNYTPTTTGTRTLTLYYQTGGTGGGSPVSPGYYENPFKITVDDEAAAPTKPSSPSPASGSTNVPTSGTLSWNTASNDGGGVSFDLYMGTGSSSNLKLYDTGRGTSYSYSGLQPGTTYYWKLIVYNGSGKSVQSDVWNFRTKAAAQVSLTIDGGTYFGTKTLTKGKSYAFNIKVKNTGDEPWSGAFYLKDGSTDLIPWGGESIAAGRTTTLSGNYTPTATGTRTLTLYYQTGGTGGGSPVSPGYYENPFKITVSEDGGTTGAPTTPASPSPANGAADVATQGTLSWTCSPNDGGSTLSFDLYMGTSDNNMSLYKSGSGTSCSYSGLQSGTTYYWKLIAYNSNNKSTHSPKWRFTTKKAADTPSGIAAPDYSSLSVSDVTATSFKVHWGAVSGALSYDVQAKSATASSYSSGMQGSGTPSRLYYEFSGLKPNTAYVFRVRSANLTQKSSYTAEYQVTTKKAETEAAQLYLYDYSGFAAKTLRVGEPCKFSTCIENRSSAPWSGNIFLKDGDENINAWYGETIAKHGANYLDFYYTPKKAGQQTLTLYYQTGGEGGGRPVNPGGLKNPLTVTTEESMAAYAGLKLSNALACEPLQFEVEKTARLSAEVANKGSLQWKGKLCFTDNGIPINQGGSFTIEAGRSSGTVTSTWTPQTSGKHEIRLCYKTDGYDADWLPVGDGVFVNSATPNVTKPVNAIIPAAVRVSHITASVVPEAVNPGAEVYCFFRITDNNGQPVRGLRLTLNCQNSSLTSTAVTTSSDDDGVAQLTIVTEGANAIARAGETVTLSNGGVSDEAGNSVQYITAWSPIKLTIRNAHVLSKVEKAKLSFERGLTGKGKGGDFVSASVGIKFPITTSLKWNESGDLTSFIIDSEANISGKLSGKIESKWKDCISAGIKGELGHSESTTFKTSEPAKATLLGMMTWIDAFYMGTSRQSRFAINVLESWFLDESSPRLTDAIEGEVVSNYFYGFGAAASAEVLKWLPESMGSVVKKLKMPSLANLIGDDGHSLELGGEAYVKFEPSKELADYKKGTRRYASNSSLKMKAYGDFKGIVGTPLFLTDKSYWNGSNMKNFFSACVTVGTMFYGSQIQSGVLSLKEETVYDNAGKSHLDELSNSFCVTTGKTVSLQDIPVCKDWLPKDAKGINAQAGLSSTTSLKMVSKGNFPRYLLQKVWTSPDEKDKVLMVFPSLSGENIIESPLAYYNVWNNDFGQSLAALQIDNADRYAIDQALKVEQQNTSRADCSLSIPIWKWESKRFDIKIDLNLDLALAVEVENYASESYWSVRDRRFFPTVLQPNTSVKEIAGEITDWFSQKIKEAFGMVDDNDNMEDRTQEMSSAYEEYTDDISLLSSSTDAKGNARRHYVPASAKRRHAGLQNIEQKDVCTMDFTLNGDGKNFDEGTRMLFTHFYPAGDLLAVTTTGDTLFVVSEVAELKARRGDTQLPTTSYGSMRLDTRVGIDDLTPFGLDEETEIGVYHANDGSDVWHYVGPAGQTVMVDSLGAYILATSIRNDVTAPAIAIDYDPETALLHFTVTENIGIRVSSMQAMVNGELRSMTAINESNYELQLTAGDLEYLVEVYASVSDIAGNRGETYQLFNLGKPQRPVAPNPIDGVEVTDLSQLANTLYIGTAEIEAGKDATLSVQMKNEVEAEGFQFDLYLPDGLSFVSDADGFPEATLSTERTTTRKTNTFEAALRPDGSLRVMAASTNGSAISGHDGEVATIRVHADESMAAGRYQLLLGNIAISDTQAVSHNVAQVRCAVTVSDGTEGIDNVTATPARRNAYIYNLQGQRVQRVVKGLYLKQGRKIVVK